MFTVTQGLEIPETQRSRKGAPRKYPFKEMLVGGSFFVPLPPGKTAATLRNSICASAKFSFHAPGHVSMRGVEEDGVSGLRVWRIK